MPFATIGAISAVGSLASGLMGADAARDASQAQVGASDRATQNTREMFNIVNDQAAPMRVSAYNALADIGQGFGQADSTLGRGQASGNIPTGYFNHQFNQDDFYKNAPGYQFRLGQGQMAATNALNLTGGLGGNFAKGLQDYTQNFASNEWSNAFNQYTGQQQNIFNRLSTIAGFGNTANSTVAGAANNASNSMANSIMAGGQASAAGSVGQANAIGNGINNAASWYTLSNMLSNNNG